MKNLIRIFYCAILFHICVCTQDRKFLKALVQWNKNNSCLEDIHKMIHENRFNEMLDSWSNFTQKYTHGNSIDFGEFDKCMSFKHEVVQPQYCLIQYQYKKSSNRKVISVPPKITPLNRNWKNLNVRFGGAICLPNSCSDQNLKDIIKEVLNGNDFVQSNDYDQSEFCIHVEIKNEIDLFFIISVICLLLIIISIAIGSYLTNYLPISFWIKFFQCFSMQRNLKSLVTIPNDKSQISCLNGMKAISTIGIFFMHSNLFRMAFPFRDGKELSMLTNSRYSDFVISLLILMDTFLVISGMLVARSLIKSKKISLWKFYLQRYMRLTSLIIVLIAYAAINIFIYHMIPKPYFHLDHLMNDCKNYGWTTIFHIQSFFNPMSMCIPHSWYVSVLFQLIIIAPLIHLILRRQKSFIKYVCYGLILIFALVLRSAIFMTRTTYFESETAVVIEMNNDIVAFTYFTPFIRIFPFFSGVLLAHILEEDTKVELSSNEKIKIFFIKFGFYASIVAIVAYIFIYPLSKNLTMIYGIIWIFATNFIIYVCYIGHGGLINDFLSMGFWVPISKMGLTIYLISPFFQGVLIITKTQSYFSYPVHEIIIGFLCDVVIASIPIVLIYLSIECSFTNLGKLLTSTKGKGMKIEIKK